MTYLSVAKKFEGHFPLTSDAVKIFSDPRVEAVWQELLQEKGLVEKDLNRKQFNLLGCEFINKLASHK